jgi:hypothetical protein
MNLVRLWLMPEQQQQQQQQRISPATAEPINTHHLELTRPSCVVCCLLNQNQIRCIRPRTRWLGDAEAFPDDACPQASSDSLHGLPVPPSDWVRACRSTTRSAAVAVLIAAAAAAAGGQDGKELSAACLQAALYSTRLRAAGHDSSALQHV